MSKFLSPPNNFFHKFAPSKPCLNVQMAMYSNNYSSECLFARMYIRTLKSIRSNDYSSESRSSNDYLSMCELIRLPNVYLSECLVRRFGASTQEMVMTNLKQSSIFISIFIDHNGSRMNNNISGLIKSQ